MVDNLTVSPGTGATVAADDVGGALVQRVKLTWGPDGTANDADAASGKPLPSQLRHSDGTVISDATGIKISSTNLATQQTSQQPFSAGAQGVYLPTDHATLPLAMSTSVLLNGKTELTPKRTRIAVSDMGQNTIVPAVTNRKIRVLAWDLSSAAPVNVKWQSEAVDQTGIYHMTARNDLARGFNIMGWVETRSAEALKLWLSAAVPVGGVVCYVEID